MVLTFNQQILSKTKGEDFIAIQDLFDLVKDQEFLVILAHPYRKRHKDDSERIDPLAATLNALARLLVRIDQPKKRTLAEKIAAGDFGM